jgi:hypothetical protein
LVTTTRPNCARPADLRCTFDQPTSRDRTGSASDDQRAIAIGSAARRSSISRISGGDGLCLEGFSR